jgi:hypothetical protein
MICSRCGNTIEPDKAKQVEATRKPVAEMPPEVRDWFKGQITDEWAEDAVAVVLVQPCPCGHLQVSAVNLVEKGKG